MVIRLAQQRDFRDIIQIVHNTPEDLLIHDDENAWYSEGMLRRVYKNKDCFLYVGEQDNKVGCFILAYANMFNEAYIDSWGLIDKKYNKCCYKMMKYVIRMLEKRYGYIWGLIDVERKDSLIGNALKKQWGFSSFYKNYAYVYKMVR